MKKKSIALFTAAALAVVSAASFAACAGHEHTYSADWSSDATSHWHQATCSENDECASAVSDKASHTFDGGEVTKEATYNTEGEKTFTCTVCGYEKTEAVAALEKTGIAYLAAESKEVVMGGMQSDSETYLTLDFDKKEAVLIVYATIDVGGGYMMRLRQVADEQAAGDMGTQYIGKGTISSTGTGTYQAVWEYETVIDQETQETAAMTLEVPITVGSDGTPSATVQMQGIHAAALTVQEISVPEGSVLSAEGTMVDGNGTTLPITTTLSVDFASGEAVVDVVASVDVGGGYIMEFCFVTDEKDPALEAENPMYYMSVMEIGKASVVRTDAVTYTATWGSGETAMTAQITLGIDGTVSAVMQIVGIHAEPVTLTAAE